MSMTKERLLFCMEQVKREILSGGEAIKALEILRQEVAAPSSPCACGEPLAEGYADPDTLADYNAGRQHMMTLFKVRGLHTEMPVIILPDEGAKE